MKYSELMIGDWVYESERTQFPMKVVNVGEDYCYLNFPENEGDVFDGNEAVPIPLDEKILEKAGFERELGTDYYILRNGMNMIALFKRPEGYVLLINCDYKPVIYVHELQNLFRVLFGIELEVKL